MSKVLVTLLYYDRPNMLKNAVKSLVNQTSKDFSLAFIDDGSKILGKPIVDQIFGDSKYYRSSSSIDDKLLGKIECGRLLNRAISEAEECDIILPFNDDDYLFPEYIAQLIDYYEANPAVHASFSHFKDWFPFSHSPETAMSLTSLNGAYVSSDEYVDFSGNRILDRYTFDCPQAQLSWRRCMDIKWPEDRIISMDAYILAQIRGRIGSWIPPCNNLMGQLYANSRSSIGGRKEGINLEHSMRYPIDFPDGFIPHNDR